MTQHLHDCRKSCRALVTEVTFSRNLAMLTVDELEKVFFNIAEFFG